MRAVRATRDVGMRSFGIARDGVRAPGSALAPPVARPGATGRPGASPWASGSRSASASGSRSASGVGVRVASSSGVFVGVGVASLSLSRSRRELPLKNVVELPSSPPMLLPATSCEPVTNTTAQRNARTPVPSASRHWREESLRRGGWTVRAVVRVPSWATSSAGGGASGSNSSCGRLHGPDAPRPDRRRRRGRALGDRADRVGGPPQQLRHHGDDDRGHRRREHGAGLPDHRDEERGGGARGAGDHQRLERQAAAALLAWLGTHAPPR